jgi:hypothetical protein
MKIFIKNLFGEKIEVDINKEEETVKDLKIKIEQKNNISQYQQILIFEGKTMENIDDLSSYEDLEEESIVYIMLKVVG